MKSHWNKIFDLEPSIEQVPVEIPKFLWTIWNMREDLQRLCPMKSIEGRLGIVIWWVLWGYKEYSEATHRYSKNNDAFLDSVVPQTQTIGTLPVTQLMKGIWDLFPNVQKSFPSLSSRDGKRFIAWFYLVFVPSDKAFPCISEAIALELKNHRNELYSIQNFDRDFSELSVEEKSLCEQESTKALSYLDEVPFEAFSQKKETPAIPEGTQSGVNIVGHATGELGVGEDVRMLSQALNTVNLPHSAFRFPRVNMARNEDFTLNSLISEDLPHKTNVFCLPGFDCFYSAVSMGESLFKGRFNIGYCQWELPYWPKPLNVVFDLMDEMWASSKFTQLSVQSEATVPVKLMPMVVELPPFHPRERTSFGIPEDKFLFMFTFDFNSSVHRKNPHAVVESFLKAFPKNDDVALIIKSSNRDVTNPDVQWVQSLCEKDKRIIWIHETLNRSDFLALLNCCDTFVSLHRSEGFGRNIAEAMLLEKPVIVTNWSGNTDFCTSENSLLVDYKIAQLESGQYSFWEGQHWADPLIEHAAEQMKSTFALSWEQRTALGTKARKTIEIGYNAKKVGQIYRAHLKELKLI